MDSRHCHRKLIQHLFMRAPVRIRCIVRRLPGTGCRFMTDPHAMRDMAGRFAPQVLCGRPLLTARRCKQRTATRPRGTCLEFDDRPGRHP